MKLISTRRHFLRLAATVSAAGLPLIGRAQNAPLRMVVSWPAGGITDSVARLLAERMAPILKRQINIDNRPGAGGQIGATHLKNMPPDGEVVMLGSINETMLSAVTHKKLPYEPLKDLQPVSLIMESPSILAVPANGPNTMAEFFAWVKENPSNVTIGVPGLGTPTFFLGLMLGARLGFSANMIPFAGGAPLATALAGGQVVAALQTFGPDFINMHNSGRIKIIAFTGDKRSTMPQFSHLPTFAEAGLPTIPSVWFGLFLPAGAKPETVQTWHQALTEVLGKDDVRARLAEFGLITRTSTPQEFADLMRRDTVVWTDIVKRTGFQQIG